MLISESKDSSSVIFWFDLTLPAAPLEFPLSGVYFSLTGVSLAFTGGTAYPGGVIPDPG